MHNIFTYQPPTQSILRSVLACSHLQIPTISICTFADLISSITSSSDLRVHTSIFRHPLGYRGHLKIVGISGVSSDSCVRLQIDACRLASSDACSHVCVSSNYGPKVCYIEVYTVQLYLGSIRCQPLAQISSKNTTYNHIA